MLEVLIDELNRSWSRNLQIVFELVRWERDVRPAAGPDLQAIVTSQTPDDYDVFIGMLWGRFGTPTPRSSSGTIEEFENAMLRRGRDGVSPEIMVYFKDAPLEPSKIDGLQLHAVHTFRDSLKDRGVLYSVFSDATGFQSSLRAHLSSLARAFSRAEETKVGAAGRSSALTPEEVRKPRKAADDDDLGYLDYVDVYQSRMDDMNAALSSIAEATERVGASVNARVQEISDSNVDLADSSRARSFIKKSADDLASYARIVQRNNPLFSSARDAAMEALSSALVLYSDLGDSDSAQLTTLRESLSGLRASAVQSNDSMLGFRQSVEGLPRLTSELNRAKRAVLSELDKFVAETEKTADIVHNIIESIDRIL